MSIEILKSGILSTVQDLGRNGYRRFGINPNGAMDAAAARLINVLLGNCENEAILEMHFPAAEILFAESIWFALGGADFSARLDDRAIENWRPVCAEKGMVLRFAEKKLGNRAYFSVRGGFEIDDWLASASTNLKAGVGGFDGRNLRKDDRLFFRQKDVIKRPRTDTKISHSLIPFYSRFPIVRVVEGAEFGLLTGGSRQEFPDQNYVVSHSSDRMGYRLSGRSVQLTEPKEMISTAVNFGTIQMLPDGQLIILMADHQTSGGYPRLANVISTDLPLLAQLGEGDQVAFHVVSIEEAENLLMEFEKNLNWLKIGVNLTAGIFK